MQYLRQDLLIKKIKLNYKSSIITLICLILFIVLPIAFTTKLSLLFEASFLYCGALLFIYFFQLIFIHINHCSINMVLLSLISLFLIYFIVLTIKVSKRIKAQKSLLKKVKNGIVLPSNLSPDIYENDVSFLKLFLSIFLLYFYAYYSMMFFNFFSGGIVLLISLIAEIFRLKAKRIKIENIYPELIEIYDGKDAKKRVIYAFISSVIFLVALILLVCLPLITVKNHSIYKALTIGNIFDIFATEIINGYLFPHKYNIFVPPIMLIIISACSIVNLLVSTMNLVRVYAFNQVEKNKLKTPKTALSLKTIAIFYLIFCSVLLKSYDLIDLNPLSHGLILFLIIIGEVFRVKSVKIK